MTRREIIAKTAAHVRSALADEPSGHDWWHVRRMWRLALWIGREERADLFVVQLAALLHDLGDWKLHGGDIEAGPRLARRWLESLGVHPEAVEHVARIIRDMSFKGAGASSRMRTPEGAVVQDADRLDAIGAIGVARAFAYGGFKRRAMHDPAVKPARHASFAHYRRARGTTVNHFHEKLLLLRERMNTASARRLAAGRHRYMRDFMRRFLREWDGRDRGE